MSDYQLIADSDLVLRVADGAYIPNDPGNRDRAEFEAWLEAGNKPDPAPAPPPQALLTGDLLEDRVQRLEERVAFLEAKLADVTGAAE
jgi:hypothetical protein